MSPTPVPSHHLAYGDDPEQFGILHLPAEPGPGPLPVVVLVHGGFWRQRWRHDLMTGLADDLARRGWAAWNLEYRRVGDPGGGFPGTLDDVAAGIDHLASPALAAAADVDLDLDRVAVVGHSAGGHLALWLGDRADGVRPAAVVAMGSVVDLTVAARDRLGSGAVIDFLGGTPDEVPDHYRVAQPAIDPERVVLLHGTEDDEVPPSQAVDGAAASGAELILLDGVDHYQVIDPTSAAWARVVEVVAGRVGPPAA